MKKIVSLKELNGIVQKPGYKKIGNWMARSITRDMALPVTWLLLHFPISANMVTLFSFMVGLGACSSFAAGSPAGILTGSLLLQLWYLLDHVDGQIARYRKEESVTGVFFDYVTHHIIHIGIFVGIAWGVFKAASDSLYLLYGIAAGAGVLLLNLAADSKFKAFYCWIEKKYIKERRDRDA